MTTLIVCPCPLLHLLRGGNGGGHGSHEAHRSHTEGEKQ
jgi:hypothetical protein